MLLPILAMGLPIIDTILVMAVRFVESPQGSHLRRFARMFKADRNHLHHRMARLAPQRKQIVLVIYFVAACFCAMALIVAAGAPRRLRTPLGLGGDGVYFFLRAFVAGAPTAAGATRGLSYTAPTTA